MKEADAPDCICSSYDGRGRSVCGIQCPLHPLDGGCPKCNRATHANQMCFECSCKDAESRITATQKVLERFYSSSIETMHQIERIATDAKFRQEENQWLSDADRVEAKRLAAVAREVFNGSIDMLNRYREARPGEYVYRE